MKCSRSSSLLLQGIALFLLGMYMIYLGNRDTYDLLMLVGFGVTGLGVLIGIASRKKI